MILIDGMVRRWPEWCKRIRWSKEVRKSSELGTVPESPAEIIIWRDDDHL